MVWNVFTAALYRRTHEVMAALDAGLPPNAGCDRFDHTLLHSVLYMHDVLQRMLDSGWDPNAKDKNGRTPVHMACFQANLQAVQQLVAAGGKLDSLSNNGETPMFDALEGSGCAEEDEVVLERCRLLRWLADRPDVDWCHKNTYGYAALDLVCIMEQGCPDNRCTDIAWAAMEAQKRQNTRWTPLRATFVGSVAAAAGISFG
jgi:ankyrin repeat protein